MRESKGLLAPILTVETRIGPDFFQTPPRININPHFVKRVPNHNQKPSEGSRGVSTSSLLRFNRLNKFSTAKRLHVATWPGGVDAAANTAFRVLIEWP